MHITSLMHTRACRIMNTILPCRGITQRLQSEDIQLFFVQILDRYTGVASQRKISEFAWIANKLNPEKMKKDFWASLRNCFNDNTSIERGGGGNWFSKKLFYLYLPFSLFPIIRFFPYTYSPSTEDQNTLTTDIFFFRPSCTMVFEPSWVLARNSWLGGRLEAQGKTNKNKKNTIMT